MQRLFRQRLAKTMNKIGGNMDKLMIIGASGHGKVIADIASCAESYSEIVFLDDDDRLSECMGYPVIGNTQNIEQYVAQYDMIVAIGNAQIRRRMMDAIEHIGGHIATLIHPRATISAYAQIGEGTVVMPGAVVNAGTVVGRGCIINTGATVDHDCIVGDYVHIAVGAHLAGTVTIGDNTWIGIGAVVSNNLHVCGNCMVGAGAVVVRDLVTPGAYVGVPARII